MIEKISLYAIAMVFITDAALAVPADVPRTGQKTVFTSGDDGALQKGIPWPNPRFVKNADTTITDNLTGLVWAPNGNVMPARDNNWDQDGTVNDGMVTWQHALDYVAKLNAEYYLGLADWRLPNISELESLVHAEYTNETCGGSPCTNNEVWLNGQGFGDIQTGSYWSSTTFASSASSAWLFITHSGVMTYTNKTNVSYVWPVRAGL